jgi:serine protease Do
MLFLRRRQPMRAASFRSGGALVAGLSLCLATVSMASADTNLPSHPLALAQATRSLQGTQLPSFAPLVRKVMRAVVTVAVIERPGLAGDDETTAPGEEHSTPFDEFLRRFFEQQGRDGAPAPPNLRRIAVASGFIIDSSGYVVTNDHVIANASKVTVLLQDNTRLSAKVVGRDPVTDLALLRVETKEPLVSVTWGDSNVVEVGDWILAVGNPFGLGGTVSFGIISARGRDIRSGPYDDFLQIDASLNRGNSGGPTFNLLGELVGINTAIYSPSGGSVGVGFAIPSTLAKPIIEQLKEHGKVERGWLGLHIQELTPEIAKGLGLPRVAGALVADVTQGGPAAKAGLKQGDVILSFNARDIAKMRDLQLVTAEAAAGRTATLEVWRDRKALSIPVTVGRMPEKTPAVKTGTEQRRPPEPASALGLGLAPLTDELRERLHLPKSAKGVVVTDIADGSQFAEFDLLAGDVIQSIDQQPMTTGQQVAKKLHDAAGDKDRTVLLLINRQGSNHYVTFSLETPGKVDRNRG